jgi:hypothetical protein
MKMSKIIVHMTNIFTKTFGDKKTLSEKCSFAAKIILAYFPQKEETKEKNWLMRSPCCVCVAVSPISTLEPAD